MKAKVGVTLLQAKEHFGEPVTGGGKKGSSPKDLRESATQQTP